MGSLASKNFPYLCEYFDVNLCGIMYKDKTLILISMFVRLSLCRNLFKKNISLIGLEFYNGYQIVLLRRKIYGRVKLVVSLYY